VAGDYDTGNCESTSVPICSKNLPLLRNLKPSECEKIMLSISYAASKV
jgi:hypothetical protein